MPMPVIQASRAASAMGHGLHRECDAPRRPRACWRGMSRFGKSTTRNVMSALQTVLPSTLISASVSAKPEPSCMIFAVTTSAWPGVTKVRSLPPSRRRGTASAEAGAARSAASPTPAPSISISSTPGISGWPGKMPFENGAFGRDGRLSADRQVVEVEVDDPVDELEILDPHCVPDIICPWQRPGRRCGRRGSSARNTARSSPCRH